MIEVTAPLRASFLGGGSDLPEFCENERGAVLSTAIKQRVRVRLRQRANSFYRIVTKNGTSSTTLKQIPDPIIAEIARRYELPGMDLEIRSDLPFGMGMGSSGALLVASLVAFAKMRGAQWSPYSVAREACEIEICALGRKVGCQDQYASALGGMNYFDFFSDREVRNSSLTSCRSFVENLERHGHLVMMGRPRNATTILNSINLNVNKENITREFLRVLVRLAEDGRKKVESGDFSGFAKLVAEGWKLKRKLASSVATTKIDTAYETAMNAGALGGKLLGAGGSGFLLLFIEPAKVSSVLSALSMSSVRLSVDRHGVQIDEY